MSTITGKGGAGGAVAPIAYTITELAKNHGIDISTADAIKAGFVERDGATLTAASEVYFIAVEAASSILKVVLKTTADKATEGNNPLKAVAAGNFVTPVAKK